MVELISSDDSSTIETLTTDTTLIINAAKCLLCDKILGYQGKFASDMKYHRSCLEERKCAFCGNSGLNTLCHFKSCFNVFHTFCLQRSNTKCSIDSLKCPFHIDKKTDKTPNYHNLFQKIANRIQSEEFRLKEYKELKGEIKPTSFSHGHIFWAIIGIQYFSNTSRLHQLPIFSVASTKSIKKPSEKSWVSKTITKLSKDLKKTRNSTKALFKKYFPGKIIKNDKMKLTEKEQLVSEAQSLRYKRFQREFLQFIEKNIKPEVLEEDAIVCAICMEEDYDDDDLIYQCSNCKVPVHMQCYGLAIEDKVWVCESCKSDSAHKNKCGLCPVIGGVLKPTTNVATSNFLTHYNLPIGTQIWTHVFCATHIENTCIKDKIKVSNIDISTIEKKKFWEICNICGTKSGACIRCSTARCKFFFHPECAKKKFLYTRNKTGFDDVSCYCELHKTSRLRKSIEIKDKKLFMDFTNFIKFYEKIDKMCVKRTVDTDFSYEEKYKMFKYVDKFLRDKRGSFDINIRWNGLDKALRGFVEDSSENYTLLEPNGLSEEDFHTGAHQGFECREFYSKYVCEIMRKELKIMKLPIIIYKPQKDSEIS